MTHPCIEQPSQALIKLICYPEVQRFCTQATKWGCEHEKVARKDYVEKQAKKHKNFQVRDSGFVIDPNHPHLGASPDGIITCDWCNGYGVLEIKCPFSCRSKSWHEEMHETSFFDHDTHGTLEVKESHAYYYQIQAQISICRAKYRDFVAWSETDVMVLHVKPWDIFINSTNSHRFFKYCILPKWYSKAPLYLCKATDSRTPLADISSNGINTNTSQKWCFCKTEDLGLMIGCDNDDCPIQ